MKLLINHIRKCASENQIIFHVSICGMHGINDYNENIANAQLVVIKNVRCNNFEISKFNMSLARNGTNSFPCVKYPIRHL